MANREGPSEVKMVKMDPKSVTKIDVKKDGIELDNTGNNIETLKADVKVKGGKWYYEVKLLTYGKIHIGWCTSNCNVQANAYNGIGNDAESYGYDGSAQRSYGPGNTSGTRYGEYWNNGDVIGTILDLEAKSISFYRNGNDMGAAFTNISVGDGFYPAISLQKKQKVSVNFGKADFKFPIMEVFPDIYPLHLRVSPDQLKDLGKLFDKYKHGNLTESAETDDLMKGTAVLTYGQDLGITDDKDPMLMIVAWKLNVTHGKAWEFTREEFVNGWALNGCSTLDAMKKKCKDWKDELKNQSKFKLFYNFVFDYLREDKKILGMEEAVLVWDMLGFHERWPLFTKWTQFLADKKSVSKDTWKLFISFVEQYPKDLSNYDENGCWPSVIDEFVEKTRAKN